MILYKNLGGDSGIISYELGDDFIKVEFREGKYTLYTYTYGSAGSSAIETMKRLAECGEGLNSYIGRNKPDFSNKI